MVKGDIIHYKHREGMEFYGIVKENPERQHVRLYLMLGKKYDGRYEWNTDFRAKVERVTVLEAV